MLFLGHQSLSRTKKLRQKEHNNQPISFHLYSLTVFELPFPLLILFQESKPSQKSVLTVLIQAHFLAMYPR